VLVSFLSSALVTTALYDSVSPKTIDCIFINPNRFILTIYSICNLANGTHYTL
jgi:hypothetical protein